jgi:hypothetical protein
MTFQAYCPYCQKKVTATTLLGGNELRHALDCDAVIEILHLPDGRPDHKWNLIDQERNNLRGHLRAT